MKIGTHYKTNFLLALYTDTTFKTRLEIEGITDANISRHYHRKSIDGISLFVVDAIDLSKEQVDTITRMDYSNSRKSCIAKAYKLMGENFLAWCPLDPTADRFINETGTYFYSGFSIVEMTNEKDAKKGLPNSPEDSTHSEARKISQKISGAFQDL